MHEEEERSFQSLLSEGRQQALFRPKDAIAPIDPFVATTTSDGGGCEGAPECVSKMRCTLGFLKSNTKQMSTKRSATQSITPLDDHLNKHAVSCTRGRRM